MNDKHIVISSIVPPWKRYLEVLTLSTSESDIILGLYRDKLNSLAWALIQYNYCKK